MLAMGDLGLAELAGRLDPRPSGGGLGDRCQMPAHLSRMWGSAPAVTSCCGSRSGLRPSSPVCILGGSEGLQWVQARGPASAEKGWVGVCPRLRPPRGFPERHL